VPSADFNSGPAIEVRESPQEYLVLVDLPGVLPEEVHVSVEGQTLLVQGRRTSRQWTQAGAMIFTERFQGEFVRRVPLPSAVDQSGLQLHFEQGLLFIRLPKPPRKLT
jgi:HSP20 family protein